MNQKSRISMQKTGLILLSLSAIVLAILLFGQPRESRIFSPTYKKTYLASRSISLSKRYDDTFVNDVMKKNILLTLAYQRGIVKNRGAIDWNLVEKPFEYTVQLPPDALYAFHDGVLTTFDKRPVLTTKAHFNSEDGFLSDGYLVGDGVCHLASLMYWVAKEAGLAVLAPTSHDFANINEVSKENGVSIYYDPSNHELSSRQNLYVVNNHTIPIKFIFKYDGDKISIGVIV